MQEHATQALEARIADLEAENSRLRSLCGEAERPAPRPSTAPKSSTNTKKAEPFNIHDLLQAAQAPADPADPADDGEAGPAARDELDEDEELARGRALVRNGRALVAGVAAKPASFHRQFVGPGAVFRYNRATLGRAAGDRYDGATFPAGDPVLEALRGDPALQHADKAYQDADGGFAVAYGFTTGPRAARRHGIDTQYFFDQGSGRLRGAVRFGEQCSGVRGLRGATLPFAHGGAVGAVMDDLLATVVRHTDTVTAVTAELSVKLKKPCPLEETLLVAAEVVERRMGGVAIEVKGRLTSSGGAVIAEARCTMFNPPPPPSG